MTTRKGTPEESIWPILVLQCENMLKHQWDFKIPEIINLLWIKGSNDKSWQKNQKFNLLIERENPYNREKIYINHQQYINHAKL